MLSMMHVPDLNSSMSLSLKKKNIGKMQRKHNKISAVNEQFSALIRLSVIKGIKIM